jgi:tRNA uridine 5-carbamoylmethylation protein Kti12
MPHLYIIRGLPGSGKSTKAKELLDWETYHYEADMFFTHNREYKFNSLLLGVAHEWCYSNAVKNLYDGYDVAVANTFTTVREMERYLKIPELLPDVEIEIVEMKTQYKSLHNVPEETIVKMKARWQEAPEGYNVKVIE